MAYGMQPQSDPTAVMGRRVVACVIDALLLAGIGIAVMAVTKNNAYTGAPTGACQVLRDRTGFSGQCVQIGSRVYTWKSGGLALGYGLSALASFLDLVLLQGTMGASVGKLIVGLRVVDAQGKPCGVGRAFVRWLILLVLDGACFLIGLLTAGLTHPHRRLGDMAGGTYVVALADVGRPIPGTAPAYHYAQGQAYPQEWAPPGLATPPAPGWGAPPPAPTWGAPPADAAPPTWGTPPTAETPGPPWATPAPAESPGPPSGAPPPAAPAPPPPVAPAPTPPAPAAPTWTTPAPPPPAATPSPPAPAPTPPPPAATPPAPAPAPPTDGESWWNKAFTDDDDTTE